MAFRSSFIRRRTALLIACPLLLAGWWFLLFRSLQKTTVVQRPKAFFANSTEDAIFELAAYDASTLGAMQFDDAEDGRNETGYSEYIVPDIVHYIQLENPYLEFVTLLSMLSAVRHHRPKVILVHSDRRSLRGKYWEHLLRVVNESSQAEALSEKTIIRLNHIRRPKYVFGRKLSSVYHASDIARMKVLRAYGGIYLDNDVYVVQSLHRFRRFEFAIGWPEGQFLGTQVLACHRNARFLRLWHQSYRSYRPTLWYFNAGELPTTSILALGRSWCTASDPDWQRQFYAVHLLARHRPHDATRQYLNEDNIRDLDCTFGEMARLAYYGTRRMLPVS
ncbi:hypothetical protein TYRP_020508 [Tyrophagus putrescentiae]|nr:hypothetical protein TYRP_020508 [Tyrophagus putrescentiae]